MPIFFVRSLFRFYFGHYHPDYLLLVNCRYRVEPLIGRDIIVPWLGVAVWQLQQSKQQMVAQVIAAITYSTGNHSVHSCFSSGTSPGQRFLNLISLRIMSFKFVSDLNWSLLVMTRLLLLVTSLVFLLVENWSGFMVQACVVMLFIRRIFASIGFIRKSL